MCYRGIGVEVEGAWLVEGTPCGLCCANGTTGNPKVGRAFGGGRIGGGGDSHKLATNTAIRQIHVPRLDEGTPCGLCYTSGTTGNPKVGHTTNFAVDVLCSFMTCCKAMFTGCGVLWGGVLAAGA